ncbi:MAG: hypothetical protein Q4P08_00735, partial [Eubacteriales bacterium]|nr:hypothetical protein [Eubacteriales bacterium]
MRAAKEAKKDSLIRPKRLAEEPINSGSELSLAKTDETELKSLDGTLPEEDDIVISVRDLWKIFRLGSTAVRALNGVDFDVKRGE